MKIIEKTLNILTGEETTIERDETLDEQKLRLESEAKQKELADAQVARAEARTVLLAKLGITEEEAQLLLS